MAGLTLVLALAAVIRLANLDALGYANHYYAAAVVSMSQSWHNFFFVVAEPGGAVSIDKPPVGLWLQVISAKIFGFNSFGLLFPQILAGILSVLVIYHLVKRYWGSGAGFLAALILALTPVVVAVDRNNTMDSTLIFTLLLAAWAFIKATETTRFRYLFFGAVLVGIGFNIKMLEAFMPLPAFLALYLFSASEAFRNKCIKLLAAFILLLIVSFSWMTIVDLTPESQRPYVGSSGDNTVFSLAFGYNGANRLLGMGGLRSMLAGSSQGNQGRNPISGGVNPIFPSGSRMDNNRRSMNNPNNPGSGLPGGTQTGPGVLNNGMGTGQPGGGPGGMTGQGNQPNMPGNQANQPVGPGMAPGVQMDRTSDFNNGAQAARMTGQAGPGGGGMFGIGNPGMLRLFTDNLKKEVSWLLPLALIGIFCLAFTARLGWPLQKDHQMLILWGGWLLISLVFFSVAGFFHTYYLYLMAPPIAVLSAVSVVVLWRLRDKSLWLSTFLITFFSGMSLLYQYSIAESFVRDVPWLPYLYIFFTVGVCLIVLDGLFLSIKPYWIDPFFQNQPLQESGRTAVGLLKKGSDTLSKVGLACIIVSILLTPGIWSGLTVNYSSENQTLPGAYNGSAKGPGVRANLLVNQDLLNYLQANTQNNLYLMAVPSSMQGADYVIATQRPVLYLGGFMGQDSVLTLDQLQTMVKEEKLRYIYSSSAGRGGGMGGQSEIFTWVTGQCRLVEGFDASTSNTGAPDGISSAGGNILGATGDRQQVSLYDCAGGPDE